MYFRFSKFLIILLLNFDKSKETFFKDLDFLKDDNNKIQTTTRCKQQQDVDDNKMQTTTRCKQ